MNGQQWRNAEKLLQRKRAHAMHLGNTGKASEITCG